MNGEELGVSARVGAYLNRIGFNGKLDGTVDTLTQLQTRHLQSVPYENLDVLQRVPLSLEIDSLYDKVVIRRRGGYCFELNALFRWLLEELGYSVTSYMARFWRDESNPPPKRRHHVLCVTLENERYLCDVGVGGIIPRQPLRLVESIDVADGSECYRFERHPEWGWILCERRRDGWRWLYSFTEEPQLPKDFLMATYWCEHSPESIFTKSAMVAVHTPQGHNSVSGKEFRIFTKDGIRTFVPANDAEYRAALRTYFGIELAGSIENAY